MTLNPMQFQPTLPGMEHLEPAPRAPEVDSALAKRRSKMFSNRGYQRGQHTQEFDTPSHRETRGKSVAPEMYGGQVQLLTEHHPMVRDAYNHFGAFETKEYAAMGKTKLYARPDITTIQGTVNSARVEQLRRNPEAGQGRRTPGFIQGLEHAGQAIITNGNHRAHADLANGALFVPIRTVPADKALSLAVDYRNRMKSRRKAAAIKRQSR